MAAETSRDPELIFRNAYKNYGSQVVLRGLHMKVPQGCIYGLLGPSGCGKTTLFKCIVGTELLDSGEIIVRAKTKKNIGYMPQHICLYNEFSINEILKYYGSLHCMKKGEVLSRIDELEKVLDLPNLHQQIVTLSGGQQRRVSLAVALLHNPKLLILDEPTVGLDPILCHSIWSYLIDLTKTEDKTVVITTHYIEEAKQADMIGLMRGGVLLAEESPRNLLEAHQTDSLEQVFLTLSQSQNNNDNSEYHGPDCDSTTQNIPLPKQKTKPPLEESTGMNWSRVNAQNGKALYYFSRNKSIFCFCIFLPIITIMLYNTCIGDSPRNIPIGYINDEAPSQLDCVSKTRSGCDVDSDLSCRYLKTLETYELSLSEFFVLEDGINAIKRNDVWALLYFPQNYSESLLNRIALQNVASDVDIELSEVSVWMDNSDKYISNLIMRDFYNGYLTFAKSLFTDCGWPVKFAGIPIRFDAVYGSISTTFLSYSTSSMSTLSQFSFPALIIGAVILSDKCDGILERSMVAGLNMKEFILSHVVIHIVILCLQTIGILLVNFFFFHMPMIGSWLLLISLMIMVGFNGLCYGMLISSICKSDKEAMVMGVGTFTFWTLVTGLVWPTEGMHYTLRSVVMLFPVVPPVEAYRAITCRNWTIFHPTVYQGFASCFIWSAIFLLCSSLLFNKTSNSSAKN